LRSLFIQELSCSGTGEHIHGFLQRLATVEGPASLNEATEFYKTLCDVAVERRLDRILCDCLAVQGQLSDLERYELGKTMAEHCLESGQ
jgi:hypothetical protein